MFAIDRVKNVYITRIRLGIGVSGFLFSQYLDEFFGPPSPYIQFVPETLPSSPLGGPKLKHVAISSSPLPPNIHGVLLNQALGQFYIFVDLRNVETQKISSVYLQMSVIVLQYVG